MLRSCYGIVICGACCLLGHIKPIAASKGTKNFTAGIFTRPSQANLERLQSHAQEVSNPLSSKYGKYFLQDELADTVGIDAATTSELSAWLSSSLQIVAEDHARLNRNRSGTSSSKETFDLVPNPHRDVITVTTNAWQVMFFWGLGIVAKSGGNMTLDVHVSDEARKLIENQTTYSLPPATVDLIVVPGAPDGFCHGFTHSGQAACEVAGPCFWHNISKRQRHTSNASNASNTTGKCVGDSAGLFCWPEREKGDFVWRCFDPLLAGDGDATRRPLEGSPPEARKRLWRRRRRGRSHRPPEQSKMLTSQSVGKQGNWHAVPINKGFVFVHMAPHGGLTWRGVEVSYSQLGVKHSLLLRSGDFTHPKESRRYLYPVRGLANHYPVVDVFICLEEHEPRQSHGCICNVTKGHDQLGRACAQALMPVPSKNPLNRIVPYPMETLTVLRKELDIPAGFLPTLPVVGSSQAVAEFADQTFGPDDLPDLYNSYGLDPSSLNISIHGSPFDTLVNETLDFGDAGEGALDMQVTTILAPGVPTAWLGIDPYNLDGFMLAMAVHLNNQPAPPLVISVSWGDSESSYPPDFIRRLDYELMKLALRGLTVLIASGDNGISSTTAKCEFQADIAGSSPWTTTVGATMASTDAAPFCRDHRFPSMDACEEHGPVVASTVAGSIITSSGYWSQQRARPAYQTNAVSKYLLRTNLSFEAGSRNLSTHCCFDSKCRCPLSSVIEVGRGAPDIAAPGHNYPTLISGEVVLTDGTSASAPAIAALIAMLNAEQLRQGEPPLGFLNPWLYKLHELVPRAFADVTVGDIASTEEWVCPFGFPATSGWDAATGLGVPRFKELLQHLPRRHRLVPPAVPEQVASANAESETAFALAANADTSNFFGIKFALVAILISLTGFLCWRQRTVGHDGNSLSRALLNNADQRETVFLRT